MMEKTIITIGDDLYGKSVGDLTEQIILMKAEITRLEAELERKKSDLNDAERFFGPKS